jgi:hypothetical protein
MLLRAVQVRLSAAGDSGEERNWLDRALGAGT